MKVCHHRKIAFIHIPKTAGMTVSNALGFGSQVRKASHRVEEDTPSKYSDYLRICFVRNPWTRAFSAFKYTQHMVAKGSVGKRSARLYVEQNPDVDFPKFVADYLIRADLRRNIHFDVQMRWLWAAQPQFIGRVERLSEDLHVLSRLLNEPLMSNRLNSSIESQSFESSFDMETRRLLEQVYRDDIRYLNYSFPASEG